MHPYRIELRFQEEPQQLAYCTPTHAATVRHLRGTSACKPVSNVICVLRCGTKVCTSYIPNMYRGTGGLSKVDPCTPQTECRRCHSEYPNLSVCVKKNNHVLQVTGGVTSRVNGRTEAPPVAPFDPRLVRDPSQPPHDASHTRYCDTLVLYFVLPVPPSPHIFTWLLCINALPPSAPRNHPDQQRCTTTLRPTKDALRIVEPIMALLLLF